MQASSSYTQIDLDTLERELATTKKHVRYADERLIDYEDDIDALIVELRASRKVVETARRVYWLGDNFHIDGQAAIELLGDALAGLEALK